MATTAFACPDCGGETLTLSCSQCAIAAYICENDCIPVPPIGLGDDGLFYCDDCWETLPPPAPAHAPPEPPPVTWSQPALL